MVKVKFSYADVPPIRLKGKRTVQQFLSVIFNFENRELRSLHFVFSTDDYLLEINKSFLQHDYYTDIITFDLSEGNGIIGEVYISIDRVKENAALQQVTFENEILRVMIHGVLHLIGYNDKKKSEITVMREKEDYYLRLFAKS